MTNCPNCGGYIKYPYNHNCQYCGTFLQITDKNIEKINNVELVDVNVELFRNPLSPNFIFRVVGKTFPKVYTYEASTKYFDVFSMDDVKPIGYSIEIPFDIFYIAKSEDNIEKVLEYILYRLPPLFKDSQRVYEKIIDKIYNISLNNWRF